MKNKLQIDQWLSKLVNELQFHFGKRLMLAVHVGSWARNDANEQSDIDINVILDSVTPEDIATYRAIIEDMPDRQMACGYFGGLNEIKLWPRDDLMTFFYGSQVLFGNMEEVIGSISQKDIFDNILTSTSIINHEVRHTMIYDEINADCAERMKGLFKTAFFVIQGWYFLEHGEYIPQKKTLLTKTSFTEDKQVMNSYEQWTENQKGREENPLGTLILLERWSSRMFERLAKIQI